MSAEAWTFAKTLNWTRRAEIAENLYRELLSRAPHLEETSPSKMAAVST